MLICLVLTGALWAHDPHDPIAAVAVSPNFAQDHTVFAATGELTLKLTLYGLLRSTDGGVNWSWTADLPNQKIVAIGFSPNYSQDQTVFVAGKGGLFVSTDQGNSWTALTTKSLVSLALSPNFATDNTLFVVTNHNAILESNDRGQTFTTLTAPALTGALTTIAVSPNYANDQTLLLGGFTDGIFESTDEGATWVQTTAGSTVSAVTALAFSPNFANDQTSYAATFGGGVLVSEDSGASWTNASTGLTDLNITSMTVSPTYAQDSTVWVAAANGGVFQSNTLGAGWTPGVTVSRIVSAPNCIHYYSVAATNNGSGNVLFLGAFEGLWTSSAANLSFQYIDTIPTRSIRYVHLSPNYANDQTVFVSTYGGGNLWSADGGSSWTFQNTGMQLPYTDASGMSPNFATDKTAFSGNKNGLQRTTDGGTTWQFMQGLGVPAYPRSLAISPNFAKDSTVYIGLGDHNGQCNSSAEPHSGEGPTSSSASGLAVSSDGGYTWTATSLTGIVVMSVALSPAFARDHTMFAASPTTGLYRTTNAGKTWKIVDPTPMAKVAVSPAFTNDGIVFAATITGGILKSNTSGRLWFPLTGTGSLRALDIEVSPGFAHDQTLFIGTAQKGLMKSTQAGKSLTQVTTFPDNLVTAIALSPQFTNDQTIFAAGYHGLYKSTDGGNSWTYTAEPARIEDSRNAGNGTSAPPTISYQGSWSAVTPSTTGSTDSYMITSESQDSATVWFTGSGIRWVGWMGPNQGSATVQLDGVTQASVSLTAPSDQFQQTIWEQHGFPCGAHTLTITGLPGAGQTISLDAFDVWTDTCPLVGGNAVR